MPVAMVPRFDSTRWATPPSLRCVRSSSTNSSSCPPTVLLLGARWASPRSRTPRSTAIPNCGRRRYTGVLYDALEVGSLKGASAQRARARLAVGSALFGLLRAGDEIPAYRLSAGSKLPGGLTLAARWKPVLEPVLAKIAATELVVDLRSGAYAALGRIPGAVEVDVLSERPDGKRTVVSHFNKAHKGRLARALAAGRTEPSDAAGVHRAGS